MKKNLNKALGYLSYAAGLENPPNHPTVYSIETTNHCNLSCETCPRQNMTRSVGEMSQELFKKVIGEAKEFTSFVLLHGMGEPLLDPLIFDRVKYCKEQGIKVGFSTNALLLNQQNCWRIVESGLDQLVISLNGVNGEQAEGFLSVKERMGEFKKVNNPYTVVQVICTKQNKDELAGFKERWLALGANEVYIKPFYDWAGQVRDSCVFPKAKHRKNHGRKLNKPPCFFPWLGFTVLWDGRVVNCSRNSNGLHCVGNLNEQSLEEVWSSPVMQRIRKDHLRGKFSEACSLCANCSDYVSIDRNPLNPRNYLRIVRKLFDFRRGM